MNQQIILINNVLTTYENNQILDYFKLNKTNRWFDGKFTNFLVNDLPIKKILNKVNQYFDLSTMVGVECWSHINTHPGWHVDMDDIHFNRTGEKKLPICSIVYYASINMIGGDFVTETTRYSPKTNDIITFAPGILHNVEDFTGERIIVAINPWSHKIEKYKTDKTLF